MVYLVGAGPGDPGLITVKALDILKRADVILYDRLINPVLLCESKPDCLLLDVGKHTGSHTKTQDETTNLLVEYGRKSIEVVRLKGGDPFLFGRGGEEAERLSHEGIPFVIVPGVTALTAVPAYAGIPLTHRDYASSVGIVTGHSAAHKSGDSVRWQKIAQGVDTLVVFMGVGSIETIIAKLSTGILNGDTPAAVIEKGTTPSQRVVIGKLSTIANDASKENIVPPALLVIGKTVSLNEYLNWYNPGPLAGLCIGITRPFEQSKSFSDRLSSLGAHPILMPVITTTETINTDEVKEIMHRIDIYDYIVFSSVNGVESFFHALKKTGMDSRGLAEKKIASIGRVTSEALERHGITADITAERFVAEGLLETLFAEGSVEGLRFLIVRSDIGRSTLRDGLVKAGAVVDHASFYSTCSAELNPYTVNMIKSGEIDIITFTSSSTVDSFFNQISPDDVCNTIKMASIGPQTSQTLRRYKIKPDIEASEYTTAGITRAILEAYNSQ